MLFVALHKSDLAADVRYETVRVIILFGYFFQQQKWIQISTFKGSQSKWLIMPTEGNDLFSLTLKFLKEKRFFLVFSLKSKNSIWCTRKICSASASS